MSFRESISDKLKQSRPNLAASSVKTYVSILYNLEKKHNANKEDLDWFDNDDKILESLKEKTPSTRKTVLSALFVLTGKASYNKAMLDDCKQSNEIYKEQKKTQKQEDAWMSSEEIKKIYDEYLVNVKAMFSRKLLANYQLINNFILLGCVTGVNGLPPRRSLDYTEMKIKNYNTLTDNYYKNGVFYFNIYKTAKQYGLQNLEVKSLAPEFNSILKKWVACNPTDYLIFSSNQQKLTSPQITRMLNIVFNKKVSIDLLRHIYLTEKYGKVQDEMKKDSTAMGHSLVEQGLYIKK